MARHPRAQPETFLHGRSAEVQVPVFQAYVLAGAGVLVELKGQRFGDIQDFQRCSEDLDFTGSEVRVHHSFRTAPDAPLGAQDELVANPVGGLETVAGIGVVDDLHHAGVISKVEENDTAVVASPVGPTGEFDLFADVRCGQFRAMVGAHVQE